MTYTVQASGTFTSSSWPSDPAPTPRTATYRVIALWPEAAMLAATQRLISDGARDGLLPAGPVAAAAEGDGGPPTVSTLTA
jgi:hypothetical protein